MKTLIATLLATAAGASFAAAPTFGLNHDPATYRNLTQKAGAAYRAAVAKCEGMKGNDQDVCMAEARLARTRAEADMLSRYNTSPVSQAKMRTEIANAEYSLARARCDAKTGADKDDCLNNAKAVHTASVADAKAGRPGASSGDADNANGASGAAGATAAGAGLAEKTKEAAHAVVEKTREVASGVAQKTEAAFDRNHENKADKPVDGKAADAGAKTRTAAQDMALTAKVKAGLIKEKDLESLGIHVETEKGVVMLSGFVNSKAEAEKAVAVAKGVDGVASVKSAIQVK